MLHVHLDEKQEEILREAHALYSQKEMDWVTFYRKVLGVDGLLRREFPTQEALFAFERTAAYAEVQQLLRKLRQRPNPPPTKEDPVKVLTIRIPQSLYETIQTEAHHNQVSMNKLCISKLMQLIDENLVPTRRKRKLPPQES